MKLPWDKEYLKISFHVIFTLLIVCIIGVIFFNVVPIIKVLFNIIYRIISVFSPLWIGIIIAYLLEPIVDYFQKIYVRFINNNYNKIETLKKKLKIKSNLVACSKPRTRVAGTALTYITILIAIIIIVFFVSSSIGSSSLGIESIAIKVMQNLNRFSNLLDNFKMNQFEITSQIYQIINLAIEQITSFVRELGNKIIINISKLGGIIVNLSIAVVISFYFVKDKNMILSKLNELSNIFIPKKINTSLKIILGDIDAVFSGYIRGQLTDAFIMAVLISISLAVIGVDFSLLIGIVSGFSNIIPYIGAFVGAILAAIVGLLSGTPIKALIAVIIIFILQQIDGIFISPKVLSTQVNLHPILVILALSVGGALFGLWGMILAIPVTAILKIFLNRYVQRKIQKNMTTETK